MNETSAIKPRLANVPRVTQQLVSKRDVQGDGGMTHIVETTKMIQVASVSSSWRFHEPTQKQIDDMAASLKTVGQLTPIVVHHVTHNTYRIIAGATRLQAAFNLGWPRIRADIITGSQLDYKIIEIAENVDRHNLTATQRRAAKDEMKRLLKQKMEMMGMTPSKGGRGNKGGLSEAARQAGVPETTARRLVESKPRQSAGSGEVSEVNGGDQAAAPKKASPYAIPRNPISAKFTIEERNRFNRYWEKNAAGASLSDCLRALTMWALEQKRF